MKLCLKIIILLHEYIENQIWNYCYLNAGLVINYNGKRYVSKNGLLDLLQRQNQCR